jgi:hypothetical protein
MQTAETEWAPAIGAGRRLGGGGYPVGSHPQASAANGSAGTPKGHHCRKIAVLVVGLIITAAPSR